jgi:hypothetical protein
MHLQSQKVADAVRQKDIREARVDRLVRVAERDVRLVQEFRSQVVRRQMDVAPVGASAHAGTQGLLHLVHVADEGGELGVAE